MSMTIRPDGAQAGIAGFVGTMTAVSVASDLRQALETQGPELAARVLHAFPKLGLPEKRGVLEAVAGKVENLAQVVRGRMETAFPEDSEKRAALGEAFLRLEHKLEGQGILAKAKLLAAAQGALARITLEPRTERAADILERIGATDCWGTQDRLLQNEVAAPGPGDDQGPATGAEEPGLEGPPISIRGRIEIE
jgi:hypothetical protein